MQPIYTTSVTASGGRNGVVKSSDGVLDLEIRTPKEMGGPGGAYTNPEQLFAAGYSACFDGALNLVARTKRIKLESTTVTANVSFGKDAEGGFQLHTVLEVQVNGVDQDTAKELVEEAHQVCPYSRATRNGNMQVELRVI
ncbi:Ohr subfamily peroxiredoxin [Brevibacillus formosus]|uniref:Ohr subfamily peroxiredoxin n=1 Tax=Brevibacillus formosus TaxID=54913 RepID=A0A220MN88_9BACL|nr:organic hydroperoxide resistance protein [Brevibacillus formosus]ASJ56432.1 Ohr subfamily peroxiredoxin [Brevibacillus formosus]